MPSHNFILVTIHNIHDSSSIPILLILLKRKPQYQIWYTPSDFWWCCWYYQKRIQQELYQTVAWLERGSYSLVSFFPSFLFFIILTYVEIMYQSYKNNSILFFQRKSHTIIDHAPSCAHKKIKSKLGVFLKESDCLGMLQCCECDNLQSF